MNRLLPVLLVALAVVVAALAVNLLLVGYADERDDPVGNLNPRAVISPTATERATTTRETTDETTTRDEPEPTATGDDHGGDDSGGGGDNSGPGGGGDDD